MIFSGNDIGRSSYGALTVKKAFEYAYMVLNQAVHSFHPAIVDTKQRCDIFASTRSVVILEGGSQFINVVYLIWTSLALTRTS